MPRATVRRRSGSTLRDLPGAVRAAYPGFIAPCLATPGERLPERGKWIHEIKHDGSPY